MAIERHTARNDRLNSYRKIMRLIHCSVDGYLKSNTLEIEHKKRRASFSAQSTDNKIKKRRICDPVMQQVYNGKGIHLTSHVDQVKPAHFLGFQLS